MKKEIKFDNKYLLKFLYSLAGIFVGLYAISPVLIGLFWLFGVLIISFHVSVWWVLTLIILLAIILGFGKNIEEWIEDRWEDASDLINKIDI